MIYAVTFAAAPNTSLFIPPSPDRESAIAIGRRGDGLRADLIKNVRASVDC